MTQMVYIVVPDYGFDGYGVPECAFSTRKLADAYVESRASGCDLEIVELPLLISAALKDKP